MIIRLIILAVCICYLAETHITFSPFSITMNRGWAALGFTLLIAGVLCIGHQYYKDGHKSGVIETINKVSEDMDKTHLN